MLEWIEQQPAVSIIAILAIATALISIGKWVGTVNSDRTSFKVFMKEVREDIKEVREDIKEVRVDIKEIRLDINELRQGLNDLRQGFNELRQGFNELLSRSPSTPTIDGQSPVKLTGFGKKVSKAGSASEWARKEAENLVETVRDKEEFEIYEACVAHVSKMFAQDSEFNKSVRANAYQSGTISNSVLQVYHVELWDRILELISNQTS